KNYDPYLRYNLLIYNIYSLKKSKLIRKYLCGAYRLHAQTAIDLEAAAGEELILENEPHRLGDFLRLAEAPERDRRSHLGQHLGTHALDHRGADEARRDRAHADAIAGQLLGPHHRHGGDPGLGGAVIGLPGVARARDARDVHNDAAAA